MRIGAAPPIVYHPPAPAPLVAAPSGRVRFVPMPALLSPPIAVGLDAARLEHNCDPAGMGRQARSNWCWAACIQMVLNYHGLPVRQEQLVAKMFGGLPDLPQSGPGIVAALSDWSVDSGGRLCRIQADPLHLDARTVLSDLSHGNPLILALTNPDGMGGHAYVVTGALYRLDRQGQPHIESFELRNPWPGAPSREQLSAQEVALRMSFATRVLVERLN